MFSDIDVGTLGVLTLRPYRASPTRSRKEDINLREGANGIGIQ